VSWEWIWWFLHTQTHTPTFNIKGTQEWLQLFGTWLAGTLSLPLPPSPKHFQQSREGGERYSF
jgi:hypothetical protein